MSGRACARGWSGGEVPLDTYFAMARGSQGETACDCGHAGHAHGVTALEMTKWFDTNYHYMVPELAAGQAFVLSSAKPVDHFLEARALGIHTRPVLLGPITFLKLAKSADEGFDPLALLPKLLPVYGEILGRLAQAGADRGQIAEAALVLDLTPNERDAFRVAYGKLARAVPGLRIMLATYFGALGDNLETALSLPVAGLHVDLVRAPEQLGPVARRAPKEMVLSLGLIDGRNVWRADLAAILDRIRRRSPAGRWAHRDRAVLPAAARAGRSRSGSHARCGREVLASPSPRRRPTSWSCSPARWRKAPARSRHG